MNATARRLAAAILLAVPLAGCGKPSIPEAPPPVPKVDAARQRVETAAQTGRLESPETLPNDVAALADEGVLVTAAMRKKAEELSAAKGEDAVKKKAGELLGMFPP